MATLTVLYPSANTRFDRAYYSGTHTPLVDTTWRKAGLTGVTIAFGEDALGGGAAPFHCITVLEFGDRATLEAALAAPDSAAVFADIANFTDAVPVAQIGT